MFNRVKLLMSIALGRMLGSTPVSLHRAAEAHNRTVDAMRDLAATVRQKVNGYEHVLAHRAKSFRMRLRGREYKPNGVQECARRVRQIEHGQLTVSNGLVRPQYYECSEGYAHPVGQPCSMYAHLHG